MSLMKMEEAAEWDIKILDDLFDPRDKDRIMRTPISPSYEDDWYWKFDTKGKYIVKSAYGSLITPLNQNRTNEDIHWTILWKLKIPEKIKIHWWRIIKGIIPAQEVGREALTLILHALYVLAIQKQSTIYLWTAPKPRVFGGHATWMQWLVDYR